jgi:hypothetical protein
MIAGIPFVLAGQLKTNTPHYIHFFSLDAALPVPVVENLQKYRCILENIDGFFSDFS